MAIFVTFMLLFSLTLMHQDRWKILRQRSWSEWIVDGSGLVFQGVLIPALQVLLLQKIYPHLLPIEIGSFGLGNPLADRILGFCLSFIAVDYLYYWNHRLLHHPYLWPWHQVHHSLIKMDVLGTSRNTLWTSFGIIYLWLHPLGIYLFQDPSGYLVGVSLTAMLDLWRHSELRLPSQSLLHRILNPWLVLPQDHTCHHQQSEQNYGANLKLWDRIHGTLQSKQPPQPLPEPPQPQIKLGKLWWPFDS